MSGRERAVGQVVEIALRDSFELWAGCPFAQRSVRDLAEITGLSKPTVRKYLKILVKAGLCVASDPVDVVGTVMYMYVEHK